MKRLMMLCLIWTLTFAREAIAGSPVIAEEASHPHADFNGIDLTKLSGLIPIHLVDPDQDFVDLAPGTVLYQQEDPEVPWRTIREKLEAGAFRVDFPYLVNQPAVDSALWKAVLLRLDGEQPHNMILEHGYASHLFELIHISDKGETHFPRNGTKRLNRGKRLLHRFPYEQVVLNPGLNLLLIKVQTQILSVSVNLHTEDNFMKRSAEGNLKMVCLLSGLLMVLIHNIASFITTGNKENGLYSVYLFGMIYYNLWAQGIGGLMFGDLTEALLITPGLCSLYLSMSAMGLFVLRFFDARRKLSPVHYSACKVVVLIVFMNAVLSLFYVNYLVGIITGLPIILLIVILSIKLAMQRFRPAIFFLVSFMPLGSSMVFMAISYLTNSSHMMFALDLLTIGILLEAGLLSAAIGDKFAITLREKNRNILLESNSRQHAFKQLEKMVYPHQIELIKSGAELEETMATGQGEGCVLALDIIESSKIDHALAKEFFRNLFRACNEAMMEGYDGKRLQARAYRVKEMGDGFLCSVGYPFKSRTGNIANDAVELALRFIEILDHEAKILQPDEPICCGVGIALGNIAGFFPETGTKEYDLYGPGIVLATRYEAMRKLIFKDKPAGSVLILQERVYKSIDKAMRKHFQLVELSPESVFVRDDPGAHRLYYRMLGPEEGKSGFEDEQPGQEAGESPRRFHVAR